MDRGKVQGRVPFGEFGIGNVALKTANKGET